MTREHATGLRGLTWVCACGLVTGIVLASVLERGERGSLWRFVAEQSALSGVPGIPGRTHRDARVLPESMASRRPAIAAIAAEYQGAVALADAADIETRIRSAAALPWSANRDVQIDALLWRLFDLDAQRAVTFVQEAGLDARFLVTLFVAWQRSDPAAAWAAFTRLQNPAAIRVAGLALVDDSTDPEGAIEAVLAILNVVDHHGFRVAVWSRLAERDPRSAVNHALSVSEPTLRQEAVRRVAAIWARGDPRSALEVVRALPRSDDRQAMRMAVMSEWAGFDPLGVLDYLSGASGEDAGGIGLAVVSIALREPMELLRSSDRLPFELREMAREQALIELTVRDPLAAIAHVEAMSGTGGRSRLLGAIASRYGQTDPEAAIAWMESRGSGSSDIYRSVVAGVAQTDFDRALELAFNSPRGVDLMSLPLAWYPDRLPAIVDRLVAGGTPQSDSMRVVLVSWAGTDPEQALQWTADNAEMLGPEVLTSLTRNLAGRDIELAAALTSRLPEALRDDWVSAVASGYGRYDPVGAMHWLSEYRFEPGYDAWAAQAIQAAAYQDPRLAASLMTELGAAAAGIAPSVTTMWSRTDPQAAARWTLQESDPAIRTRAAAGVASGWASHDYTAAERWVLDLPRGEMRDQALARLLLTDTRTVLLPDARVLDAFSSEQARAQAFDRAVSALAVTNRSRAQRLADWIRTHPD